MTPAFCFAFPIYRFCISWEVEITSLPLSSISVKTNHATEDMQKTTLPIFPFSIIAFNLNVGWKRPLITTVKTVGTRVAERMNLVPNDCTQEIDVLLGLICLCTLETNIEYTRFIIHDTILAWVGLRWDVFVIAHPVLLGEASKIPTFWLANVYAKSEEKLVASWASCFPWWKALERLEGNFAESLYILCSFLIFLPLLFWRNSSFLSWRSW